MKNRWRRATGDDTFDGYCMVVDGEDTPAVVSQIHHADGVHFMWYAIYDGVAVHSFHSFASAKRDGARYHEAVLKADAFEAAVTAIARLDERQLESLGRVMRDRKIDLKDAAAQRTAAKRGRTRKRVRRSA